MAFKYNDNLLILGSIARIVRDNDGKFQSDKTITVEFGDSSEDDICFYEDENKRAVGLSSYVPRFKDTVNGTAVYNGLSLRFYELNENGILQLLGELDEPSYAESHTTYKVTYRLPGVFEDKGLTGSSLDYVFEYKAASLAILAWLRTGQVLPAKEYETMAHNVQRARLLEMLNKYNLPATIIL